MRKAKGNGAGNGRSDGAGVGIGAGTDAQVSRAMLPIPDRTYQGTTPYDARDPAAKFAPIRPLRPPSGAPNVLIILLDDVGFGASSAFGGPCHTPTAERLAKNGLKYSRFHTTALCSPTRAAMLTGRNHHTVGMGGITEIATAAPGYTSMRPNTCAPLAEILRLNGYSTAQFGKCHEVPTWEVNPVGPFDRWPTGSGFEYFFGFVGGECNQYQPSLFEQTIPTGPNKSVADGYHLMADMTERAIRWARQQKALAADKPFFMYFAPGATHAPHHVPADWIAKYKGKFDQGWDKVREETFARQKDLGVVPKDCKLTKRHEEIPAWSDIPDDLKPVLARQMEVYAAFLGYADHHVGLLVDALADLGVLDDTLVYYIIGDNGASAEGGLHGTFNEMLYFNDAAPLETPDLMRSNIDKFGSCEAYNHYAVGWAHAMDTPYQWTKQVASHFGGTRNGTVVHWPNGFKAKGEIRSQFHHVIDITPTVLEVAGLPEPQMVNGVAQQPMHGTSMGYSFDDGAAAERHVTQYFEMFGNRGIYHNGWTALTKHTTPWAPASRPFDDDVWELYDTTKDWSQAHDLSKKHPDRLRDLQRLWLIEATKYNVLPMDDRLNERLIPELAGRPAIATGTSQIIFGGMGRLNEFSIINFKNKSFSLTAEVFVPRQGAHGIIVAQGGAFGGWTIYAKEGKPTYCYNFLGLEKFTVESDRALPPGLHQLRMEFEYDGGGVGKGGTVSLYCDGKILGKGRVDKTQPYAFSADETFDVGNDDGSPVVNGELPGEHSFNGDVHWVQIDVGTSDSDHLLSPDQRIHFAMARQ